MRFGVIEESDGWHVIVDMDGLSGYMMKACYDSPCDAIEASHHLARTVRDVVRACGIDAELGDCDE